MSASGYWRSMRRKVHLDLMKNTYNICRQADSMLEQCGGLVKMPVRDSNNPLTDPREGEVRIKRLSFEECFVREHIVVVMEV